MGSEHVRTPAHHSLPKLPPIAMVAPFVSFTVAYSWSCSPLLKPMRFLTRLFVVMQTFTPSPQAYTVSYDVIRYHALLFTPVYADGYLSSFQLMQLLISMRLYSLPLQQIMQSLIQSPQTNNAIASSGLHSRLFKHLMYQASTPMQSGPSAIPLRQSRDNQILINCISIAYNCSRSQGLPQNLDSYILRLEYQRFFKVLVFKIVSSIVDNLWRNVLFCCNYSISFFVRQLNSQLRRSSLQVQYRSYIQY